MTGGIKVNLKEQISSYVDERRDIVIEVNDKIWEYAELGLREYRSVALLEDLLEKEGFTIETGLGGIETAFVASFSTGSGPVIGILAEYDALPELSQVAGIPEKRALVEGGSGHGCGHNCIASGSFAAALAIKKYLQESGVQGTIRFYGCPGEEGGYGKVFMCRDGVFDDVDVAIAWHPADMNMVTGISMMAVQSVLFHFKGRSAHAAGGPHLGRSALDACELMNVGCNYLREHVPTDVRMHYAYLDVGGSAPNVVQSHATLHYLVRAKKIEDANGVLERVKDVARGAALMTGTTVEFETEGAISDVLLNKSLNLLMQEAMEEVGAPPFDQADFDLARQYLATHGQQGRVHAGAYMRGVLTKEELEKMLDEQGLNTAIVPYMHNPAVVGPGSTDVGDASYCTPTAQLTVTSHCMGNGGHNWQKTGQSATSIAHKGSLTAGKILALTAAKIYNQPEKLAEIRAEFVRTAPEKYECPIPADKLPEVKEGK